MNQINSLILEGNIMRVPEIRETAGHNRLAVFSVAVNRYHKKADGTFEQEVSYFDVEAWGTLAESIKKKAKKGVGCRIIGWLRQDRWKSSDGKSFSKVYVIADHIEFVKKSSESEEDTDFIPENEPNNENSQSHKSGKFGREELFGNQNSEMSAEEDFPKTAGFDIF